MKDAIPNYDYPATDEEWDGWEVREVLYHCTDAMEGPENNTVVFEMESPLAICANVFIFVRYCWDREIEDRVQQREV